MVAESFGSQIDAPGRAIREGDYKLIIFDDPKITTDTPSFDLDRVATDLAEEFELLGQAGSPDAGQEAAFDALLAKSDALGGSFGDSGSGGGGIPVSSGLSDLTPVTAAAGTTLTVTFNFDSNWTPGVPPLNNMNGIPIIPTVTLGGVTGTGMNRISRYVLQATFTLPAGAGFLDALAIFPGPNTPTFGRTFAFEVMR